MTYHPARHTEQFVAQVRGRLNQQHAVSVLIRCLAVGGAVMTGVALWYVGRGCHVPGLWYPVVFGPVFVGGGLAWWFTRRSQGQAAHFADQHFNLKDAVLSYTGFHKHGRDLGFYALQAEQTFDRVKPLNASDIAFKWPMTTVVSATVLLLTCSLLGFVKDSPERLAAMQAQALVLEQSEAINQALKDALETLEKQIQEEGLEQVLDVNVLKDWGNQLRETPDIKEAMRQYAQLEKNLSKLSMSRQQRRDQQLLDRIGRELQKDDTSRALGRQLSHRDYKKASESLAKFKIDPAAQSKAQQKQTETLKALSGRMSQEVARTRTSSARASNASKAPNETAVGPSTKKTGDPLSAKVDQLSQSAQTLSEAVRQSLKTAEGQDAQMQMAEARQQGAQRTNKDLDGLGQYMQRMAARRQAQARVNQMLQSLSQAQRGLGQGMAPGQKPGQGAGQGPDGAGQGGLDAGSGSDSTINTRPVEETDEGILDQLSGAHGSGPAATAVEEAAYGSAANDGPGARDREVTLRQIESFIRREDVPDAVKSGVKAYFENIHQLEEGN